MRCLIVIHMDWKYYVLTALVQWYEKIVCANFNQLSSSCKIPLSSQDRDKAKKLLQKPWVMENKSWRLVMDKNKNDN